MSSKRKSGAKKATKKSSNVFDHFSIDEVNEFKAVRNNTDIIIYISIMIII